MQLEAYSNAQKGETGRQVATRICASAKAWVAGGRPDLALVFISSHFVEDYEDILADLMGKLDPGYLVGCSGHGIIGAGREFEDQPVISLLLLRHPDLKITVHRAQQEQIEESTGPGFWQMETDVEPEKPRGIILLADPFTVAIDKLVHEVSEAYPEAPMIGGLASGDMSQRATHLFEGAHVHQEGALLIFLEGPIRVKTVVSQGCKPIGEPRIITRAERNIIYEIANQPALRVLNETVAALDPDEKKRAQRNIFAGLVVNEYIEEFHRGDFLVRNLIGADQETGSLALGALVRAGQTIQFQMRDAKAAREDMIELLTRARAQLKGSQVKAGMLCSCNGRGEGLFGKPDHDPATVAEILGNFPVAGFFCNGEIGPIGQRAFVHGYTCAAGLILDESTD